jgi:hypothetical protein
MLSEKALLNRGITVWREEADSSLTLAGFTGCEWLRNDNS